MNTWVKVVLLALCFDTSVIDALPSEFSQSKRSIDDRKIKSKPYTGKSSLPNGIANLEFEAFQKGSLPDDFFTVEELLAERVPTYSVQQHVFNSQFSDTKYMMEKSKLHLLSEDIEKLHKSPPHIMHAVVFAVKQNDLAKVEDLLNEVSNPESLNYGMYLSRSEVLQMTSNTESSTRVLEYLAEFNDVQIIRRSLNDAYITAAAPMHTWEGMFNTEFYVFRESTSILQSIINNDDFRFFHRAEHYSLSVDLREHVAAVFNVVDYPSKPLYNRGVRNPRRSQSGTTTDTAASSLSPFHQDTTSQVPREGGDVSYSNQQNHHIHTATSSYPGYVYPQLLNIVYNIDSNVGSSSVSQAVFETNGQTLSPSDLTIFQNNYNLPVQSVDTVVGGHVSNNACVPNNGADCLEANLDVQYLMAVSQSTPTTYYYVNDTDGQDVFLTWATAVADLENPPLVFSISYAEYEFVVSDSTASSFNAEVMKLALSGVTVLSSAGDDGVSGYRARYRPTRCGYFPYFPASSPYVTSIGGTQGPENGNPEIACQSQQDGVITTGGGFSTLFPTQSWQSQQVARYFLSLNSSANIPQSGYSTKGRGYPDLAALAYNYEIVTNGNTVQVSGTSASTPVVAGMISLANARRQAAGKPSLGWLNPMLYAYGGNFTSDVTSGENNCAALAEVCCGQGFYAAEGWDPLTGLGTLNFTEFLDTVLTIVNPGGVAVDAPTPLPTALPGVPTAAPSAKPSAPLTISPTTVPTQQPGWFYFDVHSDDACSDTVRSSVGVPTGICLIQYNRSEAAVNSRMYSCGGLYGTVSIFNDTMCSSNALVVTHTYFLGCNEAQAHYYGNDGYYSSNLACYTSSVSPSYTQLPSPVNNGQFMVRSSYASVEGCSDESTISSYAGVLQNYCYNVYDVTTGTQSSYNYIYPFLIIYNNYNCNPDDVEENDGYYEVSTTCKAFPYLLASSEESDVHSNGIYDPAEYNSNINKKSHQKARQSHDNRKKPNKQKNADNKEIEYPFSNRLAAEQSSLTVRNAAEADLAYYYYYYYYYQIDDDFSYYFGGPTRLYEVWTLGQAPYTNAPSPSPGSPTKAPTNTIDQNFVFFVRQTLVGISSSEFLASGAYDLNVRVLSFSVCEAMKGVQPNNIYIEKVVANANTNEAASSNAHLAGAYLPYDASSKNDNRKLLSLKLSSVFNVQHNIDHSVNLPANPDRKEKQNPWVSWLQNWFKESGKGSVRYHLRRLLLSSYASTTSTPSCNITYQLQLNSKDAGYRSGTAAYDSLSEQLENSVSSGAFSRSLTYYATLLSASDLAVNVTSDSVYIYGFEIEHASRSNDDYSGIISGAIIAFLIIFSMIFYCNRTYVNRVCYGHHRGSGTGDEDMEGHYSTPPMATTAVVVSSNRQTMQAEVARPSTFERPSTVTHGGDVVYIEASKVIITDPNAARNSSSSAIGANSSANNTTAPEGGNRSIMSVLSGGRIGGGGTSGAHHGRSSVVPMMPQFSQSSSSTPPSTAEEDTRHGETPYSILQVNSTDGAAGGHTSSSSNEVRGSSTTFSTERTIGSSPTVVSTSSTATSGASAVPTATARPFIPVITSAVAVSGGSGNRSRSNSRTRQGRARSNSQGRSRSNSSSGTNAVRSALHPPPNSNL